MSKSKKWQKTLSELQISDNERQSVKNIMSRLRGNLQTEKNIIDDQTDLELPDRRSERDLGEQLDQSLDQKNQKDQSFLQTEEVVIPKPQVTQNPVLLEPRSENAVPIEPPSIGTLSTETLVIFNQARGYKSLNILDDEIMPTLGAYEQIVLRRLYRLSYGFNKQVTDSVTLNTLATRCNLSESTVKRALKILVERKLIEVQINKTGERFGNRYHILTGIIQNPILLEPRLNRTGSSQTPIIDDDHDDLKRHDHHLNQTEHEKSVMTIYQTITQNSWTKADTATYQKIKNAPIDKIEIAIRLATQRASSRPNSLAFFTKEILSVASPKTNRSKQKNAMQKIIEQIKNSKIGSSYSISDLSYWVKEACLRNDITYDTDLFDELTT